MGIHRGRASSAAILQMHDVAAKLALPNLKRARGSCALVWIG